MLVLVRSKQVSWALGLVWEFLDSCDGGGGHGDGGGDDGGNGG